MRIEKKIVTYKTRKEDNLQQICLIFNTTPYRVRELNPHLNLDDMKQGTSLLVDINSSGKEGATIQNPNQFRTLDAPDMTFMKKPLFLQILPVENSTWDKQDNLMIEEFQIKQANPVKNQKLDIATPIYYRTLNGNVPGIMTITQTDLYASPSRLS